MPTYIILSAVSRPGLSAMLHKIADKINLYYHFGANTIDFVMRTKKRTDRTKKHLEMVCIPFFPQMSELWKGPIMTLEFHFSISQLRKNWSIAMIDSGADQRWSIAFFIFNCLYFLQNIDVFATILLNN